MKKKLKFDRDGYLDERQLEKFEDSGCGDLTSFYGTARGDKKTIARLKKLLKGRC